MQSLATVELPNDIDEEGSVPIAAYQRVVARTDRLPPDDLSMAILGLFGEVGSLLAALKKRRRDAAFNSIYDDEIEEEWGDALWYLACIANRARMDVSVLAQRGLRDLIDWDEVEPEFGSLGDLSIAEAGTPEDVTDAMVILAEAAGEIVGHLRAGKLKNNRDTLSGDLVDIMRALIGVANHAGIDMDIAARENARKALSRFADERHYPPLVDEGMPDHERLPRKLEIFIEEHEIAGKTYVIQKCQGLIIGDRLTDNKREEDNYRFHDVFHVAYAVHLGWSPVLRALFRVKRKSDPKIDEGEDGARAILIEEGVATFIFGRAKSRGFYEGIKSLDYDTLKLVQEFVRGFEPQQCALWQWEQAILDGFAVFRELVKHRRGWVVADISAHKMTFRRAEEVPT